jgi:hypothetical protein
MAGGLSVSRRTEAALGRNWPDRFGAVNGKKQTFADRTRRRRRIIDFDKICYQR